MIKIPKAFHEVLGETQSAKSLLLVITTVCIATVLWARPIFDVNDVGLWRKLIALLLFVDIAAGAVANLTEGTNRFYSTRPAHRWGFIALHIHLLVFAALLDLPLLPFVLIWAYVIAATVSLNVLMEWKDQRLLAGAFVAVGWMGLGLLPLDPLGLVVSALFLFKLCYAFAVDHASGRAS
ncbi:MAG: hypothetical protein WD046_11710 [Paracoccaceae bacterium]